MPSRRDWLIAALGFTLSLVVGIVMLGMFVRFLDRDFQEPIDAPALYAPKG
jgi:hypothetical protein